jgi:hypothetical protein
MKFRILVALALVGLLTAEASAFGRRSRGCQTTCSQPPTYTYVQPTVYSGCTSCPLLSQPVFVNQVGQPTFPALNNIRSTVFGDCSTGTCSARPGLTVVPAAASGPQVLPATNR